MELYPAEIRELQRLVEEWVIHEQRELEATFKDASDTTTFLEVAKRLKAKGFEALPQEDKMNILTPDNIRFTLTGMGAIESYCHDDTLVGKPYEAMVKDRTGKENNVDLEEYGVRVKVRRELPIDAESPTLQTLLDRWGSVKKAFRILRRWTFFAPAWGVRFDLSMVRSTPKDARGQFRWQTNFRDLNITKQPATYEIEVELLRPEDIDIAQEVANAAAEGKQNPVAARAIKNLVRGIGEVLRGIQKHSVLIQKAQAKRALDAYKTLTKTDRFRGVAPITMLKENMQAEHLEKTPNVRNGYNVTDKADGLRMMAFVDSRGELFMIDMSMTVYRTGLFRPACKNSLMDGEFVTRKRDGTAVQQYCVFDAYIGVDGKDVSGLGFAPSAPGDLNGGRYEQMMTWVTRWNDGDGPTIMAGSGVTQGNKILVSAKAFLFAAAGDKEIFDRCRECLAGAREYYTDGLILTPNALPLPERPGIGWEPQLKWKPSEDNSVDFLVVFDKDPETRLDRIDEGVKPSTGENAQYKTIRLYVGSERDPAYENPRGTVLYEQPLPGARKQMRKKHEYKPVIFNPVELPDTMGSICYSTVELDEASGEEFCRCENGDPIMDRSIVECRYEPGNDPGWRWIPMRIRYDKTERFLRGIIGRTLNKDTSAEGVWNSIHDPITKYMITTGSETPSQKEIEEMKGAVAAAAAGDVKRVYYDRKGQQSREGQKDDITLVEGLRKFHRIFIKEKILLSTGLRGGNKSLVDLACGQGGDLWSWLNLKAGFVYGTDIAGEGIRDPQNGIYRRYLNGVMKYGGYDRVGRMMFTIGSSARRLATGEAGATPEESNMMRAIYGQVAPDGPIPKFIEKYGQGRLKRGADCVAIMFALHYFFENEGSLDTFLLNVSDSLALGGLFIGCCFDGQKIFDGLARIPEGGSLVGKESGAEIWKMTKRYSQTEFTSGPESLGMPIDVEFISIGTENREFLVNFEYLKQKMAGIGCDLLTAAECKELGLNHSTELFEDTWNAAKKKGNIFEMGPKVKQYSFFNRWFIFKRRRGGVQEEIIEAVVVPAAVPAPGEEAAAAAAPAKKTAAERTAELRAKMAAKKAGEAPAASGAAGGSSAAEGGPAAVAGGPKTYETWQVIKFFQDAAPKDVFGLKDNTAVRWLAPSAPFPITDAYTGAKYPSVEHYIAGMKYKLATNNPDVGARLFSDKGTVHAEFLAIRATETGQGARALKDDREQELIGAERKKVTAESSPAAMKRYGAVFDESKWLPVKDTVLRDALKQRYTTDKRFREIVNAAKAKNLYLLYYTGPQSGSELGGKHATNKTIDGQNKVGTMIMALAKYSV